MNESRFVYVTYIRTTPQRLWQALTDPQFIKQYWCATSHECAWTRGSTWKIKKPDGTLADSGEVLEIEPHKRFVLSWRNEFRPELTEEGFSRLTCELEQVGESVKLTVIHEMDKPESKLINAVSTGWPHILSSLKSMLETGESLVETRTWPKGV